MTEIRGGLLAALLSCALMSLATTSQAQSGAAGMAWGKFTSTNPGFSAEWSAAGDQAESLRGLTSPKAGDPETIAKAFIAENSRVLGLAQGAKGLRLDRRVWDGTDTHLSYQQTIDGLPVFNGFVDVHVNARGQIYLVNNTAISTPVAQAFSRAPLMSEAAAMTAASSRRHAFFDKSGSPIALKVKPVGRPQLGIQKTEGGARLAYRVDLGPVSYVIDANSGAVLNTIDHVQSASGTGTIFDPNPVNTLTNGNLRDRDDTNYAALQGAYFTDKVLPGITKTGTGAATRYVLTGPYIKVVDHSNARLAQCGVDAADVVRKPPGASRNGKFPVNRSVANFEHVMVYFHIDRNQRYIQNTLGINNNWNAAIPVDGHGLTDDNSFHCNGILAFGDGGVDDAEDADVVLHEYGHALQANATGGRFSSAGGHARAMGEGFGDYWAYQARIGGTYGPCFAEWDGQGTCLRRVDKNKKFPRDIVGESHKDGEIWSRGLSDLLRKIGRTKANKIILKSHFLVPAANLTFSKGLTALVDADEALFAGANKQDICAALTDRGIGAPACGIWIKMNWNKLGADVDLSFIPPAPLQTVYYGNRTPNWGDQGTTEDDPELYQDCISSCTYEQITVSSLVTPGTYKVRAHYYSDHGKGAASVSIEVLRGPQRIFNGSRTLAATGAEWLPFNIVVRDSKSEPEIVILDQIGTLRPSALPKK